MKLRGIQYIVVLISFFLRKMELQISKYQDLLRKKIYQSEIKIYHEIGEARFEEFYAYYEEEFQKVSFIILNFAFNHFA